MNKREKLSAIRTISRRPLSVPVDGACRLSIRAESGFTLIELLVVCALIATMVSMLSPALSSVRESSKIVACSNNLRQIGLALNAYADENNDNYPPCWSVADPVAWYARLDPYLGSPFAENRVWVCPSFKPYTTNARSYGMTLYVGCAPWCGRRANVPDLSRYVVVTEKNSTTDYVTFCYPPGFSYPTYAPDVQTCFRVSHRSNKAANYLFADGHVSLFDGDQRTSPIWYFGP
ncbi:MAG: type II secretion system protein [Verrucomicrobiae bacterium]|nr:type II secretion system protein [Verrucomicrobiae bacterium]